MKKAKAILYSTALYQGELVEAKDVVKGRPYTCAVCGGEMIPRQGKQKRPHFAHKARTENCTPESALHHGFKILLANKLKECIATQQPLEIEWGCRYCLETHIGNLVKKASRVEVEYNLGKCQPDIALLDAADRVIAAIEVVVTHAPERQALDYYEDEKIGVVVFRLKSDEDLKRISSKMHPEEVYSCLNPRCDRCHERTNKRELVVVQSECRRCHQPMPVAAFMGGGLCGTFFPSDIELAKSKGVHIGYWKSKRSPWRRPTSACPHCKAVIGLTWLWDEHVDPDLGLPRKNYGISGYYCNRCETDLNGHKEVKRRD